MANLPIDMYPEAIQVNVQDVLSCVLDGCKPSVFRMLGKEIEMHYVCCLYRLRDREIKAYYNTNMEIRSNPPPIIQSIQKTVEDLTGEEYTYVLVNVYRDGTDFLGYHRDKESLDGPIASLSLGATRRFLVREDATKEISTYHLHHGDLLLMRRGCQRKYKHSIPKMSVSDLVDHLTSHNIPIPKKKTLANLHEATKETLPVRVNLTFRY